MNQLIETLIEDALAFAYADEEQIDEDYSVSQLERISHAFKNLSATEKKQVRSVLTNMMEAAKTSGNEDRADQLESLPQQLGIE